MASEQKVKVTIDDIIPELIDSISIEKIKFEFPKSVIDRYVHAEHEWNSMNNFIREQSKNLEYARIDPPKYLRKRYGLFEVQFRFIGLAWYLLDEYFKGNVTIKKDVEPKS